MRFHLAWNVPSLHWLARVAMAFLLILSTFSRVLAQAPASPPPAGAPLIHSIIVSQPIICPGDRLGVILMGTQSGVASFDVVGVAQGVRMREVVPGRYEGYLLVPPYLRVREAAVVVRLSQGGREVTRSADQVLSIRAARLTPIVSPTAPPGPLFVIVATPVKGQVINGDFSVTGTATPLALIEVHARFKLALIPGTITAGGQQFHSSGRADANGTYRVLIQLPAALQQTSIVVKVRATNAAGESTEWQSFTFPTIRVD